MAEYTAKKLLGGIANGHDLPVEWQGREIWKSPGHDIFSTYEPRSFWHGTDKITVWVEVNLPQAAFNDILWWHREMYRGDLLDSQRSLLRESMAAAASYTNIIMVVGYAALIAFWTQGKDWFTKPTLLASGIAIALSIFLFVVWEVFSMLYRSLINYSIAQAVNSPGLFEERIAKHRERVEKFVDGSRNGWFIVAGLALLSAFSGFSIIFSGFVHGLFLRFW
ncbi:hypothetical protein [Xanthomonas arboricola]|uniref:hypothetical protein n=1 Tax=Xanthomonas arboricola TaxID=56448 RepID=UPI0011899001|nr:hypothetical protein [Xanthomonas arboricola]QDS15163.1 hypothetical protein FPL04_05565 [Xanthomonas arboricola]